MASLDLYQIKNLTYFYPNTEEHALQIEELSIREGEFILAVGGSGSGKSSLARLLAGLLPGFYGGKFGGAALYRDKRLDPYQTGELAGIAGMVFQDPEKQMVMTTVEAEIAFGLENLGLPQAEMHRRTAEVMSFLGLTSLRSEFTANLSGGQKQKLAIASVLAMLPEVLILDEPTSQIDPVAAEEILNLCKRINEEMGITVILAEQRLERCFHLADRIFYMEKGAVTFDGTPTVFAKWAFDRNIPFVPPVSRVFAELRTELGSELNPEILPVTIKEARELLRRKTGQQSADLGRNLKAPRVLGGKGETQQSGKIPKTRCSTWTRFFSRTRFMHAFFKKTKRQMDGRLAKIGTEPVLQLKKAWFTYPNGREALKGIDIRLAEGEFLTILGENGAGKSTLLRMMAGLLKPGRGQAVLLGKDMSKSKAGDPRIGYLSQNPNDYLFQDSVRDEIASTLQNFKQPDEGRVEALLEQFGLWSQRNKNPRDLSGGERQRVALASVLVTRPRLLILDEPTRGMDYRLKRQLGDLLQTIMAEGCSLVMVTHDVEFAAQYATRTAVMFDGQIVSEGTTHEVLGSSMFYSTQMAKVFRGYGQAVLTTEEAQARLRSIFASHGGDCR